jgi:hypothetical protein
MFAKRSRLRSRLPSSTNRKCSQSRSEQEVQPVALSGEPEKGSGIETLGLVVGRDDDRDVQVLHVPPVELSFQT